jgi:hypothetical protein
VIFATIIVWIYNQSPLWEEVGQTSPMFHGHHAVFCRPDDERRRFKGSQMVGRDKQISSLAGPHISGEVASDLPLSQQGV